MAIGFDLLQVSVKSLTPKLTQWHHRTPEFH